MKVFPVFAIHEGSESMTLNILRLVRSLTAAMLLVTMSRADELKLGPAKTYQSPSHKATATLQCTAEAKVKLGGDLPLEFRIEVQDCGTFLFNAVLEGDLDLPAKLLLFDEQGRAVCDLLKSRLGESHRPRFNNFVYLNHRQYVGRRMDLTVGNGFRSEKIRPGKYTIQLVYSYLLFARPYDQVRDGLDAYQGWRADHEGDDVMRSNGVAIEILP